MKKDNLDQLFKELEGAFDMEHPLEGHQDRFLQKLNAQKGVTSIPTKTKKWNWKYLSIAATFIVLVSLGIGIVNNRGGDEVQISPEVQQSQLYFTSLIEEEVERLNAIADEDTKVIIDDVMLQLEKLENDYTVLESKIQNDGANKQILHAMIINFQTRINLLQDVINQIEEIKEQKINSDENNII